MILLCGNSDMDLLLKHQLLLADTYSAFSSSSFFSED